VVLIHNEQEIELGPDKIYATHYRAEGQRFIVVAPPLFEEDARLRKVLVNLSRYLCDAGYDVVRFDYYGAGFSPGRYEDVTLERTRQNLDDAVAYCRGKGADTIQSVGVRFGAYLALGALGRASLDRVVAWEPVLNPAAYIKEVLRSEVATQMLIYGEVRQDRDRLIEAMRSHGRMFVEGYLISSELYDQLAQGQVVETDRLIADSRDFSFVYWQTRREQKKWLSNGVGSYWVDGVRFGFNHIRYMAPRSDELYRQTLEELKRDEKAPGTI
jgi:alpha/beta superfamily hydrolase